jgi:hypothetical protein
LSSYRTTCELLGTHVGRCSENHSLLRELGFVLATRTQPDCDTKIQYLHEIELITVPGQHDIVGLQISMHNAQFVGFVQRMAHLLND